MKIFILVICGLVTCLGGGVARAYALVNVSPVFYVALGDSRAAAPTWTSVLAGDHCGRTANAYPVLVAKALRVSYRSVACTGATSDDVLRGQKILGARPLRPQVDALSVHTGLVTVSIGGNDIDWSRLILPCFPLFGDGHCRTNHTMEAAITTALRAFTLKLDHLLAEIALRAPVARVVVVGHGGYFGSRGCLPDAPMSDLDAPTVAAFFDRFNQVLRVGAARRGASYVDVAGPAAGHDTCAGARRWFLGDWPRGDIQTRHPTPLGSANIARLIVGVVRHGR
ncbi:MAG: SGNH/GDSL hydrolase family protein [Gordonia sp. (in: high G+C Gram-positive bacteria)]